ncbi:MAG: phosphoribosylformylglycinamidine synthase subunit PurL [Spirochaetota bacterium]|nr:phosphoribosylformylglycinamidine synthase subunit PurL [Spirochaetota bacterium]
MEITNELILKHNLTLEEYDKIKKILGREPNITELGMYSVLWSEHCSYKSSKPLLSGFPTTGEHIIVGPGENAGVIDIGDGLAVVMKVESHNHPSAIEPYQGAATGVGGIIRDIITMGARPVALLNSLRFGPYESPRTKHLLSGVVSGIAGYGNCVGIPTVAGEIYFEDCYDGNPLVNAMCVGILEVKHLVRAVAEGEGNPVIYAGSTTGRDGLGGAAFASKELSDKSDEDRPAVQVGDPFLEKQLIEACMDISRKEYLVGMQDMGAAGLTSSSSEMAGKGSGGMVLDLSAVPLRDDNLTPYEMMLSESQERMLLVVKKGHEEDALSVFHKWGLKAVVAGYVEENAYLTVKHNGEIVAEVPAKSLSNDAPVYNRPAKKPSYLDNLPAVPEEAVKPDIDFNNSLLKLLSAPSIASKRPVYEQYDHMIGTNTSVRPGESDAAVVRIKGTQKAIALSIDGNSRYCHLNPFVGGQIAVAEAARNVICMGAKPLAITDGLNFGNPENEEVFWTFQQAIEGIKTACHSLNTPVVSGNVSLYNESSGVSIFPTPIIGMLGLIDNINQHVTMGFKAADDVIFLLGDSLEELGGSEYLKVLYNTTGDHCPKLDIKLEGEIQDVCLTLIRRGLVSSAHDLSEGGLTVALAESCMAGDMGASVIIGETGLSKAAQLFGESQSRILISVAPENLYEAINYMEYKDIPYLQLGMVTTEKELKVDKDIKLSLDQLGKAYNSFKI